MSAPTAGLHRGMLREQRPNSFGVAGGDPHAKTCRVQRRTMRRPRHPVPPNAVNVCTVMAQLPTAGELSRERAFRLTRVASCSSERATPRRSKSHRGWRRAPGSDPPGCGAVLPCRHGSGRSPGHAAYNSCRVLPVARSRTRSPKLRVRAPSSRPPDLVVPALGGRPRPCLASNVFPSTAAADLGLLAEGVVLTRVTTRSVVSRSVNEWQSFHDGRRGAQARSLTFVFLRADLVHDRMS